MQLAQRQEDGDTLRGYLQWQAGASGKADQRLTVLPPACATQLWDIFCELSMMRPNSGMGMSPIPGVEYEAWQRMTGITLTAWELQTLKAMDFAARGASSDAARQAREKSE